MPDFGELGGTGLRSSFGFVEHEFLRDLQGDKGTRTYREMSDNDAVIGALILAFKLVLRRVKWTVRPAEESEAGQQAAEFMETVLYQDMSHTWADFISEVMSMLVYGWSYFEIVYKRRLGPTQTDASKRSRFDDGMIGVRKLAPRSQHTLVRWVFDGDGGISGMVQAVDGVTGEIFLPIQKCLHFRTESAGNNPEGRSLLRNAYRSWRYKSLIEDKEVIGIERELVGLPVISIPGQLLADTSPEAQAKVASYVDIAKNLRLNEQSGVVIPSDPYVNDEGSLSSVRKVEIKLLSTAGSRTIDTGGAIKRYEAAIARSVLADFLTLGTTVGSWALSKSKTDLYLAACEAVMEQVKSPVNAFLIPRVWAFNGLPYELMPEADHDAVAPADLAELGSFLERMARAGMPLFPDAAVENVLRVLAGLPERDVDAELPEVPAVPEGQPAQGERGAAGDADTEEE